MERTLKQITKEFGVKRRAIQGYESAGLVAPTGHTKNGYLLYDDESVTRILQIKFYSDIGFKIRTEIKEVIDAPVDIKKEALEKKLVELKQEQQKYEKLISQTEQIIRNL